MAPALAFWTAVSLVFYVFAGYPLVLIALRLVIHRDVRRAPTRPFVSLLIPAYNEARVIGRKIGNSLALEYPPDRMEIVVVSDGSTDRTLDIARSIDGVRVLAFPEHRGKVAALNAAVPQLRGEIVVFSDASALLAPDSVRRLVENFGDPSVGAASGRYKVIQPGDVNNGVSEHFYWKYEAFLKVQESRLASTLGAHGHLYAIRKELYPFPPPETINDDYVIPLSVLARGFRAVYEPAAVVYEEAREMMGFSRRIRVMAGNLQQLQHLRLLLRPLQPLPLLFFVSHKVGRLLAPLALLAAFAANLFLLNARPYQVILAAQAVFYALAASGLSDRLRPGALRLPYYFCMVNGAAFFGLYHTLTRRRSMVWK
jgi:poly-beta-1,6-N-acetyl-D-glucosamine synthase